MADMPERIWATWKEDFGEVEIGTWADTVRFAPLGTEYVRADALPAAQATVTPHDPAKVAALVEAADAMLDAFCIQEDSEQIVAYEALSAALAAMKEG